MEVFHLHPQNPEARLVKQIAKIFQSGGIVVYPTDSGYSIGCDVNHPKALERLYQIKKPLKKYVMSLLLPDLSAITEFAIVSNASYRIIKERVPGHYTFILPAQTHIARKLKVKRWEIGVRIPNHPFLSLLFAELPTTILNTAARIRDDEDFTDPDDLERVFRNLADAIVHCGETPVDPTNIINLCGSEPELVRGEW
jgi:tRNA threonylcarbamoyl adenosine modification protein (Sua5/YciO/YrdC/YwlC family)